MYQAGKEVTFSDGSVYMVDKVYTLDAQEMKRLELFHANRVRMTRISGVGSDILDFAITKED